MKKIVVLLGISLMALNVFSQSMDDFWSKFKSNEYKSSIDVLDKIIDQEPNNIEALTAYIMVSDYLDHNENCFSAMKKLYATGKNKNEYLQVFWNTSALGFFGEEEEDERIEFFEQIIADPEVDGSIKALAHGSIASNQYKYGDFDDYWETKEKVGNLNKWQMVGVFENISASGFDKNYEPINQPKGTASFINKHDASVYWFNSDVFKVGEWTRAIYHFDTDNSIVYSQTFVNSEVDQECQFRIGTSGSVKGWVNDELVVSEVEEFNNNLDTYRSTIKLNKGWNRILVQIGTSEISNQNFMLRLTDAKGNPLSNISHDNSYHDYSKKSGENIQKIPVEATKFFEAKIKSEPNNLANYLIISKYYLDNDFTNKAQKHLLKAEELADNSSMVLFRLLELYLRMDNETQLGAAMEKMKKIDPDDELSISLEYQEALDNENYDLADELHAKLVAQKGNTAEMILEEIELENAKGNNQKVLDLANDGYAKFPNNVDFIQYKYTILSKVDQNPVGAQKILKKYLKKRYSNTVQKMYAQSWAARNNIAMFFFEYEKLLDVQPYAYGVINDLASIYNQINQKQKAIEYIDKLIELAPFIGSPYAQKGEIYLELDEQELAEENLRLAVKYNPTDFDSRERLRELEGKSSLFEEFNDKDYEQLFKDSPSKEDYPEDNSLILTEEKNIIIHEKGAVEERNTILVKVFDKAGVDTWKEYSISRSRSQYLLVEKAEVYKADGSKTLAETSGGYCVFTNLEPGDAIFVQYKLQHHYQGSLADHFWGSQYFDYFIPAQNIELSVLYNENESPLRFEVTNGEIERNEKQVGDFKLVEYRATNCESIKSETLMPALTDVGRVLHYSTMEDWQFVADWYSDLASTKAKVDYDVEQLAADLFPDGYDGLTAEDKMKTIYDYVVNEIRYSSISFRQSGFIPQKASQVITTKIGDCKDVSTLFVALCDVVGVDANLVLVNSRYKGQQAMVLPSINFNHCIAKVNIDNEDRYIELTSDLYPFGTVGSSLEGSFILEINKEGGNTEPTYIPSNSKSINAIYRDSEVTFEGKNVFVAKNTVKTGSIGAGMRSSYRDEGDEARRKRMQEAVSGDFANVKLKEVNFNETIENNADSVTYNYSYTITDPFTRISNLEILKVPLADNIEPIEFLAVDDRKFGVELWSYFGYSVAEETMKMVMPAGKKMAELPENVVVDNDIVSYSLTFSNEGKDLRIIRKIRFKKSYIPIEEYDLFKKSMEKIIDADDIQVGLTAS